MTTDYVGFFLNSSSDIVELETIEMSHPSFTKIYRVVRNATKGITATIETSEIVTFDYYPLQITPANASNDLDQQITVNIGDVGQVLPTELDAVALADTFRIKPTVKYRLYRSDDLSAPMLGPFILQVENFSFKRQGCSFDAKAPSLNLSRTGEVFSLDRFPMLRGYT